jgi:hypothetical protein
MLLAFSSQMPKRICGKRNPINTKSYLVQGKIINKRTGVYQQPEVFFHNSEPKQTVF